MNRWNDVRHLRGAAVLILVGVLALLNQWHVLSWGKSWPFFLIVPGLLLLAERAAWTADVRDQQATQSMYGAQPVSHPSDVLSRAGRTGAPGDRSSSLEWESAVEGPASSPSGQQSAPSSERKDW